MSGQQSRNVFFNMKQYASFCQIVSVTRCWNKKLPNTSKSYPKWSLSSFDFKSYIFQNSLKVAKHLVYIPIYVKKLSPRPLKIAQSDHTGCYVFARLMILL